MHPTALPIHRTRLSGRPGRDPSERVVAITVEQVVTIVGMRTPGEQAPATTLPEASARRSISNGTNYARWCNELAPAELRWPIRDKDTGEPFMDFTIPQEIADYLIELDRFIEREIKPLEDKDDNKRFFDHRREAARTDWDRDGLPNEKWEALLQEARCAADRAGHYRYPLPKQYGGKNGTNLGMAFIREHLAAKGLGLHNDLQTEHSIVANNVGVLLMLAYGSDDQKKQWVEGLLSGSMGFAFGISEPEHGSDATHMDTKAVREGNGWRINGAKTWNTGIHKAKHDLIFARTGGKAGDASGITAFLVPTNSDGFRLEEMLWT